MFPLLPCKFSLTSMEATFELLSVVPWYLVKSHFHCGKLYLDENTKVNVSYTANSKTRMHTQCLFTPFDLLQYAPVLTFYCVRVPPTGLATGATSILPDSLLSDSKYLGILD